MTRHPRAFDRSFFTIICRADNGDIYSAERTLCNDDRAAVVRDIANGQIDNVLSVFEFNPAEQWSCDISEDIAEQILKEDGVLDHVRDFLEDQLGCQTIAEAIREVA